ncbi:GFA family protein [Pelagibius sp. CAU 1746]|uniref:GFA family protein n=1 Tax=Pelagibius sp. CAU 1746 TaxID=3140370 RepID=UPI00325BA4E1
MSAETEVRTGGCTCGAVRYRVEGAMRPVIACHCGQCRKTLTNYSAFSAARRGDLQIENAEGVTWFESSPGVRRGFCRRCGGALFWDRTGNDFISVAAGSVDQPSGLRQVRHIYVEDKADFYELSDGLETFPQDHGDDQWPEDGD